MSLSVEATDKFSSGKNMEIEKRKRTMSHWCLLACAAALPILGCHKSGNVSDVSTSQPAPPPAGIEIPAGTPANALAGEPEPSLTRQLRVFIRQKGRLPEDMEELARARQVEIPNPPAGKKWAIDVQTTEVKAVER
jgi:hypothetical protein